jgi:ATP-dependent DNA helicase RecG
LNKPIVPAPANPTAAAPLLALPGVGPARAQELSDLGIHTPADLLEYFPRTYIQESPERDISNLKPGEIQSARGTVIAVDYVQGERPRFVVTLSDGLRSLWLLFFHGGWLRGRIVPGMTLRARAKVQIFRHSLQMVNPKWETIDADVPRIEESVYRPIYPATAGLPSDVIHRIIKSNLDAGVANVREWFAAPLLRKRKLLSRDQAYRAIHLPADSREARRARRRLVYDELMLMQLGLGISRRQRDRPLSAPAIRVDKLVDQRIRNRLSFDLTRSQEKCVWDIVRDMQSGRPMNRLLQGDVGSGKTAVAVYAMLSAAANKLQSALLAPTEVLAEQHYLTLSNLLEGSRLKVGLFTQRSRKRGREELQAELSAGEIHVAVGTQALLQEDVEFAQLGLVVVDEQHRLGVLQRATLRDKALCPHYLVMTATPIPRTLALSYFADFDVSTIDELPPGRRPIQSRWLPCSRAAEAYIFLRQQIARGRQAYIVLPQVEDDGVDGTKSVTRELDRLQRGPLSGLRLAALHGRMNTDEKLSVMTSFRAGRIDILIATTVIEVGIDVPNATVILIDQADRFGLAQLHQLRGRVGRGSEESHCILLSDARGTGAEPRLTAITQIQSGFEIAEMDLKLRGPGEFFGSRQHGLPEFKLADLSKELPLLVWAKDDALAILKDDPDLTEPVHRHLRAALVRQFGETLGLAQIG